MLHQSPVPGVMEFVRFGIRKCPHICHLSTKPDPSVILRIGTNTEILQKETQNFFNLHHTPLSDPMLLDPQVELRIQNSPDDVLLSIHGEVLYRRVYRSIRWMLFTWYLFRHRNLTVEVRPVADPQCLKFRWKVDGTSRWTGHQINLLSGYSYYFFDMNSGKVKLHVVDRLVPPAVRNSWLWWYLERFRAVTSPKPLVGTSENK